MKDTNVVVLCGDGAVALFIPLVEKWSRVLQPGEWKGVQFYLIGSVPPAAGEFSQLDTRIVNSHNTAFYCFDDAPPTGMDLFASIGEKIGNSDRVHLHIVCDSDGKETDYNWILHLVQATKEMQALSFDYTFFLILGMSRSPVEKTGMLSLIHAVNGSCVLIGEENSHGGRVPPEQRRSATILAILLNAMGELMLTHEKSYSIGYSALNANGAELKRLCESKVCQTLREVLGAPVTSVSEARDEIDFFPEGVTSIAEIRNWMEQYTRQRLKKPTGVSLRNAWVTTRFDPSLNPSEAIRRMKRFVDLNYTDVPEVRENAKKLAWETEERICWQLCKSILTSCISEQVTEDLIEVFHRIASEEAQPVGCTYPAMPLGLRLGNLLGKGKNDEYVNECKKSVYRSIDRYIVEKNVSVYAAELEACYRRIGAWIQKAQGRDEDEGQYYTAAGLIQEIQRELNSNEYGDLLQLETKYDDYAAALGKLNLTLRDLKSGTGNQFFQKDGILSEKEWRAFITAAGKNVEKKLPSEFRGDFFHVLNAELSTQEERERFFDEFLNMGIRMYYNLQAEQSPGISYYLADQRLTDHWFNAKEHIYKAKNTDNAENLTLYPLGSLSADQLLQDDSIYFRNKGQVAGNRGRNLFSEAFEGKKESGGARNTDRYSLFDKAEEPAEPVKKPEARKEKVKKTGSVRLIPDENNEYRLSWEWHGNDEMAMVEFSQYGEKVGKIAAISVKEFKKNGNNMNVTFAVMSGKPVPAGVLSVTIRDQNNNIFIDSEPVPGRREVVRYLIRGNSLELKPGSRNAIEKLVLRTTDTDGTTTFYPLYASQEDRPWFYQGLQLSDGAIIEDPTQGKGEIIPIDMGK